MDATHSGYLDKRGMQELFGKFNVNVGNDELNAILRRLDTDDDERLSYTEFADGLAPSQLSSQDIERITVPTPAMRETPSP
jgi:Ca2+-binding EF-hand superfamily protein